MKIVLAQVNLIVGDIEYNTQKIITTSAEAKASYGADLVVFPELTLTGYPPEDLLYRKALYNEQEKALNVLLSSLKATVIIGLAHLDETTGFVRNRALCLSDGVVLATYDKQKLPNYSVFDEMRYFEMGQEACVFEYMGSRIGLLICEDLWFREPALRLKQAGAELVISLNASPYHMTQEEARIEQLQQRQQETKLPIVYANLVGGQDELVFDGASLIALADARVERIGASFEEALIPLEWMRDAGTLEYEPRLPLGKESEVYQALVLGVRDYVTKNAFKGAVIGLSGGIDSALTLAIACDALGADCVEAVMMPFDYTSKASLEDAAEQAQRLGVQYRVLPIADMYHSTLELLNGVWGDTEKGVAEQNIQARSRGMLLMAMSNKEGKIVLTTGNKSELAVGYATLYGDMAGGFDVLKDVPKMLVYQLANYRNSLSEVIPVRVIERAPSAELAPDQVDEDSLPPYAELDNILEMYIEQDLSIDDIIAFGFEPETVKRIAHLVDVNEHKRRQAAPGVRISRRAFGKDRRYPITSGFRRQFD